MTANAAAPRAAMHRGAVTWYVYLLLGYITFALNIQGNVLPFLKQELGLGYALASLHSSGMALGIVTVGLFGERIVRLTGRRLGLGIASVGVASGLVLLGVAPSVFISIPACVAIGFFSAMIPAISFALLADDQGPWRDAAFTEGNAVAYLFALCAPLLMSLSLALELGWRGPIFLGAVAGYLIVVLFRGAVFPVQTIAEETRHGRLPAAYWAYWGLMATSVAAEFGILLFAPAYLEEGIGLSKTAAAGAAAAFFVAMLVGRTAGSALVRFIPVRPMVFGSLCIALAGFALYWLPSDPAVVVAGLFVVGLGIALLFPLSLSLAVEAAGPLKEAASARATLAAGVALLTLPASLGWLADRVGLASALLVILAMIVAAFFFLGLGDMLLRREASELKARGLA